MPILKKLNPEIEEIEKKLEEQEKNLMEANRALELFLERFKGLDDISALAEAFSVSKTEIENFTNKDYVDSMNKIMTINIPEQHTRFPPSDPSRGMEWGITEDQKKELIKNAIPVFSTDTGNIKGLNFKFDNFYWTGLDFGINHTASRAVTTSMLEHDETEDLMKKVNDRLEIFARTVDPKKDIEIEALNNLVKDIFKDEPNIKDLEVADQMDLLRFYITLYTASFFSGPKLQTNEGEGLLIMKRVFDKLYNYAYQGVVKTLPIFSLSGFKTIRTPCVIATRRMRNKKLRGTNVDPSKPKFDFHNGIYTILGFRHTIDSATGFFSEFLVIKSPGNTISGKDI